MEQHDTQLNKEKDAQRGPTHPNFSPNQRQQQSVLDVLPSTTTSPFASTPSTTILSTSNASSSFNSTSILDPPPPYVPPRAHSSNDVNVSNFNTIINPSPGSSLGLRNNPEQNLDIFTPSCPSVVVSSSGSATPKAVPVSGSLFSSTIAHAGTSASGASLKKTSSSVDDIIWADMRRRRLRRRSCSGATDDYSGNDTLRYEHATYSDREIQDSANSDVNENHYDEHLYTYTSSDNDNNHDDPGYTRLRSTSTGLENDMGETEAKVDEQVRRINLSSSNKLNLPGS